MRCMLLSDYYKSCSKYLKLILNYNLLIELQIFRLSLTSLYITVSQWRINGLLFYLVVMSNNLLTVKTPLLRELHWLKVMERIQFRLCVLTPCCPHGTAPPYLAVTLYLVADVGGRRRLRSASTSTLVIASTRRSTLGDRAFTVAVARAWNALMSSVRAVPTMLLFRRELKRTLFQTSFPDWCQTFCCIVWHSWHRLTL